MAKIFRENSRENGVDDDDNNIDYDPEKGGAKYRLPFALCKAKGIEIKDWWTPRDAWNALERGGVTDDVSEEYEEFRRRKKREYQKDKKALYKQRADIKKKQLADENQNPTKGYTHIDGAIDGATRNGEMSHEQADSGHVNPRYNDNIQRLAIGYQTNCQTCVATYIARRKGYDVTALPNLNNFAIMNLSFNTSLAYTDGDGKHPERVNIGSMRKLPDAIQENRIYSVEWSWGRRGAGHIVVGGKDKEGLYLYDPQTNKTYRGGAIDSFTKNARRMKMMDLTNCKMDETFCDKIMKGVKK